MKSGRTAYDEYEDKSLDVKGEVTEYVLPKHFKNLHYCTFVALPGKTPIDLPLLYQRGIINDTTSVECVYDLGKADMSGEMELKKVSLEVNLTRHLVKKGVNEKFIKGCLHYNYCDVRDYLPRNSVHAMYIDTCSKYDYTFPEWLRKIDKTVVRGATVIFNFAFHCYKSHRLCFPPNEKTKCEFRMFNWKPEMEADRRRELSIAANDFLQVVNKGKKRYELLELVSYRNSIDGDTDERRQCCPMGIMVFRKK